jgi:hypothetical protein
VFRRRTLAVTAVGLALVGCGSDASESGGRSAPGASATTPGSSRVEGDRRGSTTVPGSTPTGTVPATAATPGSAAPPTTAAGPATPAQPSTSTSAVVDEPAPPRSWTARCPTPTPSPLGCAAVRGRVLAIQSVDPDGDGDLHVIAVGGDVTAPGITVFDVRTALRPSRDPVKGEWVTGAGPVFRGSLRQRQIQVDRFRVWRPRG